MKKIVRTFFLRRLRVARLGMLMMIMLVSTASWAQKYDSDFTQTRVMKISGKTTTMHGHITFDGNDHLSMMYSDPEGDYFIIDGAMVKVNLMKKKAELNSEKVKAVQLQRSTLLNCLSGEWEKAAAENKADTIVTEKDGFRNVLIQAKGKIPRGGYSSVDLTYRISDGLVVKMILEEAIGVVNTYEIE